MIGLLRFVGILNAAVWFGTAIFFTFGTGLVPFSQEMKSLLGQANYPYFSGAIAQLFIARYFSFQLGCAVVAVVHLLAEWLYLGKHSQKLQIGLLVRAGFGGPPRRLLAAAQDANAACHQIRA